MHNAESYKKGKQKATTLKKTTVLWLPRSYYFMSTIHPHLTKEKTGAIKEGWRQKQKQRSSRLFGGRIYSIPCRASCFASVDLEE